VALIIGLFLTLPGVPTHADCSRLIVAADPSYPPLHWFDGKKMQGASIEIAKRVLDDLKIPYEIRYVGPFSRLMVLAEHGEVDMIATLKKTPERERFLLFPTTPAFSNPVSVFALRDHSFKFNTRSDLIGLRGGISRGNKFGARFDEYLAEKLTIEQANTPENNFEKLKAGRLDYLVTGYYTGMAYLIKGGYESKFVALRPFVSDTNNFLALTKNGKCGDKLDEINTKLMQLKKKGVLDDLIQQSFKTWKTNPVIGEKTINTNPSLVQ
jgi:polar amino acid transport system substrate-binding protein